MDLLKTQISEILYLATKKLLNAHKEKYYMQYYFHSVC